MEIRVIPRGTKIVDCQYHLKSLNRQSFFNLTEMRKLDHYICITSQLWLTSHSRSTLVLLATGTPGTSREIYSEDADGETRTRNPSVINRVLQPLSKTAQKLLLGES